MTVHASPRVFDVVIVGGGPAGLGLLTALRTSRLTAHLKFALVERQPLDSARQWHLPHHVWSNRASSLTRKSLSFLQKIGVQLDAARMQPYQGMRVWDALARAGGRIAFDSPEALGHMVENANIVKSLVSRLDCLRGVSIYDNASVDRISLGGSNPGWDSSQWPHLALSNGQSLVARLLVGADGIFSPVRAFAGIDARGWDYERQGLVASLKVADSMSLAYQRFLPTGPIALLPLPGGHASLVWSTTPERAQHLRRLAEEDLLAMVNAAFRLSMVDLDYMFGLTSGQAQEFAWRSRAEHQVPPMVTKVQADSVASFPLRLRQATTYKAHRVALVGDAAHTMHPLAGQGLNMGLADAQALAGAIEAAVEVGADIGNELTCLDKYNHDAWMANNRMLGVVDKLHWLYSAQAAPIVAARSLGLDLVNRMGPLKHWIMQQAGSCLPRSSVKACWTIR